LLVFSVEEWRDELDATQNHLHSRVLVKELVERIVIGEWQKKEDDP